jgi:hypothetical protein
MSPIDRSVSLESLFGPNDLRLFLHFGNDSVDHRQPYLGYVSHYDYMRHPALGSRERRILWRVDLLTLGKSADSSKMRASHFCPSGSRSAGRSSSEISLADSPSGRSEYMLASEKITWRIEIVTNLSDQSAAAMGLVGGPPAPFSSNDMT